MSYYEGLPIYRAAMDVTVKVDRLLQRFPKGQKYSLGTQLRTATVEVVTLVARANRRTDRDRLLAVLCDRIEDLKLLINIGKEVQAFASFNQFAERMDEVVTLARQAEGGAARPSRKFGRSRARAVPRGLAHLFEPLGAPPSPKEQA
jgi:23S rRNA-intervening sequence protein